MALNSEFCAILSSTRNKNKQNGVGSGYVAQFVVFIKTWGTNRMGIVVHVWDSSTQEAGAGG